MKWFKHDTDASIDAKLQELLLDYGAVGYGVYWYCLELIAKDVTPKNITFELEQDARIIARNLNLTIQETTNIMKKMVELELFDFSNNKLRCIKMAYRLDDFTRKGVNAEEIVSNFKNSQDKVRQSPTKSDKVHLDKIRIDKIRIDKNREEKKNIIDFSKHENVNKSACNEWIAYKKYKSKASITKLLNFLNKFTHDEQQQIVDTSIMNSWTGLFPPKKNQPTKDKSLQEKNKEFLDNYFNEKNDDAIEGELL